jgi:hypothetical protein
MWVKGKSIKRPLFSQTLLNESIKREREENLRCLENQAKQALLEEYRKWEDVFIEIAGVNPSPMTIEAIYKLLDMVKDKAVRMIAPPRKTFAKYLENASHEYRQGKNLCGIRDKVKTMVSGGRLRRKK